MQCNCTTAGGSVSECYTTGVAVVTCMCFSFALLNHFQNNQGSYEVYTNGACVFLHGSQHVRAGGTMKSHVTSSALAPLACRRVSKVFGKHSTDDLCTYSQDPESLK